MLLCESGRGDPGDGGVRGGAGLFGLVAVWPPAAPHSGAAGVCPHLGAEGRNGPGAVGAGLCLAAGPGAVGLSHRDCGCGAERPGAGAGPAADGPAGRRSSCGRRTNWGTTLRRGPGKLSTERGGGPFGGVRRTTAGGGDRLLHYLSERGERLHHPPPGCAGGGDDGGGHHARRLPGGVPGGAGAAGCATPPTAPS